MRNNYEELKAWQKSYELCIELYANQKNVEGADKVYRKQTLESLTPGILEPSSPTKVEKNLILKPEYHFSSTAQPHLLIGPPYSRQHGRPFARHPQTSM